MTAPKTLNWRVQSDDDGGFDEIVVRSRAKKGPALLHAEMMDSRSIFVTVGDLKIWAHVGRDGKARVTMTEGEAEVPR